MSRALTSDERGDTPLSPLSDVTLGPRVHDRVREYKSVRGSAVSSRMDPTKCLWCTETFFGYRHYTRCCRRLYHFDCLTRHTWHLHPAKRVCPHCRAINFGEPFKVWPRFEQYISEQYTYLKEQEKRGECFGGLVVQTSRCGREDPGSIPGRGMD